MNKQGKYNEDLLSQYIKPEKIEKAPEGFTTRVMNSIQAESALARKKEGLFKTKLVPLISVAVSASLIIAVLIIPNNQANDSIIHLPAFIKNLEFSLPKIDLNSVMTFHLPEMILYTVTGILMLSLFDRALNMFFHREK